MNVCVCIKQVPDVAAPMQVRGGELVYDAARAVLNAYDASAVEAALVLTEAHGGEVDVVLVGPERAAETVRKALAMGATRGAHLVVPEGTPLDSAAVAELLARHLAGPLAEGRYDAVFTGKQAQDSDAGLAGGMLAERLGLPYVTNAVGLALDADAVVATRQGDAGQEVVALPFPCLVTCSNDMNDPRIPSLKGIMASKKKEVATAPAADVPAATTRVTGYEPLPTRPPGTRLDGEPAVQARTLVAALERAVLGG